jgi:hypothetical protein
MTLCQWRDQIGLVDLNTVGLVCDKSNRHQTAVLQRREPKCGSQAGLHGCGREAPAGGVMRMTGQATSWVVYVMTIHGKTSGMNAVCEQGEWEAMERDRPGYHTLVRAGIRTEGEAERLARGGQADRNTSNPSELKPPRR